MAASIIQWALRQRARLSRQVIDLLVAPAGLFYADRSGHGRGNAQMFVGSPGCEQPEELRIGSCNLSESGSGSFYADLSGEGSP